MIDDTLRAAAFEFAPQSTAVIDIERGRILACNRAFSVLLGYSEEELVDRPLSIIVAHASQKTMQDALQATRTSPLLGHATSLHLRREDDTDVQVHMRCRLIDDGPSPVRAVIAVDEMTPTHDDQDAFFAMLAHELRNRLSNFRLAVQLLDREDVPAGSRWRWGLSVMAQQVADLSQLTDDLLDVSRMARGRLAPKRETIDFRGLVTDVVRDRPKPSRSDAESEDTATVEFVDTIDPTQTATVRGDTERLKQVLALLLEIAQTPESETLQLWLSADDDNVRVQVRGPGIQPGLFPDDLDMFAAAARAAAARPGLGLEPLLVSGLVERMDGRLIVRPGEIEMTLPQIESALPAVEAGTTPMSESPPEGRKVLVVDDDRGAANTLALLLSTAGHAVDKAHTAEQGLERALIFRPQVALLDLRLPGMNGYDLARRLRAEFGQSLTIIALTGLDDPADRARVREAGFDHHLVKPIDVEVLKSLLT